MKQRYYDLHLQSRDKIIFWLIQDNEKTKTRLWLKQDYDWSNITIETIT